MQNSHNMLFSRCTLRGMVGGGGALPEKLQSGSEFLSFRSDEHKNLLRNQTISVGLNIRTGKAIKWNALVWVVITHLVGPRHGCHQLQMGHVQAVEVGTHFRQQQLSVP